MSRVTEDLEIKIELLAYFNKIKDGVGVKIVGFGDKIGVLAFA